MCGIGVVIGCAETNDSRFQALREEIIQGIRNRGPDALHWSCVGDRDAELIGAVLHMRGKETVPQPLLSETGDALLWNGEVFSGQDVGTWNDGNGEIGVEENDTQAVFHAFQEESDVMKVLQRIEGPFAFVYYRVSVSFCFEP